VTKSRGINRSKHRWSAEDIACLRFWFPHNRSQDLANTMGLRLLQVVQQANRLKLHKSAAYLASPDAPRQWTRSPRVRVSVKERDRAG